MRNNFLPFSRPDISEEAIRDVGDVIRSGWITTGPKCAEFELKFCEYTGCSNAVTVSSATSGMEVVLKALGIGPGDEVITPSLTWVSTVNLVVLTGATPVFADVDKNTLLVTPGTIEQKITSRTRLIIPVHFAGVPADLNPIRKLANAHNIFLLEDSAHAIGTEYRGERIGRTGTSIFSFHPIKNITTGEGGMITSDNSELSKRARRLKFHGLGVDAHDRNTQGRAPQAEVIEPGYKCNLTDISAVLGLHQLSRLDDFISRRSCLAQRYNEKLKEIDEIIPLSIPSYPHKHAWHLFVVRLDIDKTALNRDEFMAQLKNRNIGTGLHFKAVHLQKFYTESAGTSRGMLPATEWNSDRICSLPLFPAMTEKDVDQTVDTIKEVLKSNR